MSPVCRGSQGGGDGSQGGGDAIIPLPVPEVSPQSPRNAMEFMEKYVYYAAPQAFGSQFGGYSFGSFGLPLWIEDDTSAKFVGNGKNAIKLGSIARASAEIGLQYGDQLLYETESYVTKDPLIYDAMILKNVVKLFVGIISEIFKRFEMMGLTAWKTDEPNPKGFIYGDVRKKDS